MEESNVTRADAMEIDLRSLLAAYLRKWWLIVLAAVMAGAAALAFTVYFVTPLYRANVSIYVNNIRSTQDVSQVTSADLAASQRLVNTYISICKSNRVLEKAAEQLDGDYSPEQLAEMLSAEQVNQTEIFRVYITHEDPKEAARVANVMAEVAPQEISSLIEGSSARIIDYAKVPRSRYSPNYERSVMLGAAVGALLAVLYLTLAHLLDTRIKHEDDLAAFNVPVLGRIPSFESLQDNKRRGYSARPAQSQEDAGTEQKEEASK